MVCWVALLLLAVGLAASSARAQSTVTVTSEPSGAEVWDGSRKLGTTPFTLGPPLGTRRLRLVLARHEPKTISVDVRALQQRRTAVTLVPKGVLALTHRDPAVYGAQVFVDGVAAGALGEAGTTLDVVADDGAHLVTVVQANFEVWSHRATFGPRSREERTVELEPAYGVLVVSGGDDVVGVPVYLDPDQPEQVLLGVTPVSTRVQTGRHAVQLRYVGLPPVHQFVDVHVDKVATVSFETPHLDRHLTDTGSGRVDLARARAACWKNDGGACVVAAFKSRSDADRANLYRRGCQLGDGFACYGYGYLRREVSGIDAAGYLARACEAGVEQACLARYAPVERLLDPRENAGDWETFETHQRERREEFGVATQSSVAIARTEVVYQDVGVRAAFDVTRAVTLDLDYGLRFRAIKARDAVSDATDLGGRFGFGLTLGARLRPSEGPWSLRVAGRATAYIEANDSAGGMISLGWRRYETALDLGVMLEPAPTRYQDVTAFGSSYRAVQDQWLWSPFLSFTRVFQSKSAE